MDNSDVCINIKSYVVYDLETTTLPAYGTPKITEISMIAVVRDHILNHNNIQKLPRVSNKLNLCVYPQKIISLDAEKITGLSNLLLEDQSPFNEKIFNILIDFIERMPQPICLIAHNGNRFDFPILQSELKKIGKKLPDHLWCADSLPAFRYLYSGKPTQKLDMGCGIIELPKSISVKIDVESLLTDADDFDDALCDALDSAEKTLITQGTNEEGVSDSVNMTPKNFENLLVDEFVDCVKTTSMLSSPSSVKKMQKINETTPKRPRGRSVNKIPQANFARSENSYTPDPVAHSLESKRSRRAGPIKCLAFDGVNGGHPKSFKLVDIFQYLCNQEPINAHIAEADTTMLLQSIIASREEFLDWVDRNAINFNGVKKMW